MYVMNKLFDIVLVQYFKLTGYIYIYINLSQTMYMFVNFIHFVLLELYSC